MAKTPDQVLVAAKAAYKADKTNKALKKAYKAAQVAADTWKAEQAASEAKSAKKSAKKAKKDKKRKAEEPAVAEVEVPTKKAKKAKKAKKEAPKVEAPKVDAASLKAATKTAKAAHKASPSDAALKAAYKAARKAEKEFKPEAETTTETPVETPAADDEDDLSSLKKTTSESSAPAATGDMPALANEKLFLGNLSWNIDDDTIKDFFKDCGTPNDIFWLEDKETGKFKGCGFITFDTKEEAVKAQAKSGEYVMDRDIKIEFAKPRPGGERGGFKKGAGNDRGASRPLSERPENCTTVFAGNLSWDVDDDSMREFAKDAGEVKSIRWVTDRDTGDFKGCGFIEFYDSESVDKFVKKNGEDMLGRNLRLDYAAPKPPREESW